MYAKEIFVRTGAQKKGHFVLTSGRHTADYFNKDAIYMYPVEISRLAREIAKSYKDDNIEAVIAPAIGGVILSQWVAFHLSKLTGRNIFALYAEKDETGKGFVIKRGYDQIIKGKTVLVVEDVLTTGGSVRKVVELVRVYGGVVAGIGAILNRGRVTADMVGNSTKMMAIADINFPNWPEDDCHLCRDSIPVNVDMGKGREFLLKKEKNK